MKKYLMLSIILIVYMIPITTSAQDECNFVGLLDAWAGATVEGMPNGAVYGYLVNLGTEADTLLTASTDVAEVVEVHETTIGDDDVMRMQPLPDGLMLTPHNYVQLQRGSYHIMLINLLQQLEDGSTFDITLVFESAGEVVVTVPVHHIEHMMDMGMDMNHDETMGDMSMDTNHDDEMEDMPLIVDEACAGVHALGAWARPGVAMPNSAAYALLVNLGESDTMLVSSTGSVAEAIELHEMIMDDGDVMRMSPVEEGILIPAGGVAQLKPGGLHIMLIGLTQDLKTGDNVSLILTFDDDTIIELEVPVQEPIESAPMMMHG